MIKKINIIYLLFFPILLFGQLSFVPNYGQWDNDFKYKTSLKYGGLFFEEDGVKMHLISASDLNKKHGEQAHDTHSQEIVHHHALKQKWLGSLIPQIKGANPLEYHHNYFLGKNPLTWKGNVPVYQSLYYENIYNRISIDYHNHDNQLKYNWIVAPGGNPSTIKWNYEGADSVWIKENKIIIQTSVGFVTEELPAVYTLQNNIKTPVAAAFTLNNNVFGFDIKHYNKKDTLVIDPVLEFASFSGSLADNWGFTATYDNLGNLYAGGIVMNAGYPTTMGALQTNHANPTDSNPTPDYGVDCSITKFNASGNNLIYSSYLGGSSQDQPHSMFVDSLGSLYILGVTGSADFPTTTNAYQDTFSGGTNTSISAYKFPNGTDMFVVKINPSGSALEGATFLGGTKNDGLNKKMSLNYGDVSRGEIVVSKDNKVFVVASTMSDDFPLVNPSQSVHGGNQDAVVLSLNNTLTSVNWATFYGGNLDDAGYGIKTGTNGTAYICGGTKSNNLAGTSGKFNSQYQGGSHDGFVAQFNQSDGALLGTSYLGTTTYDQAFLIDLDKFNNVYLFGQTLGNYPVSANVYTNNSGKQFIHKLNNNLTTSIFSTVFGKGHSSIDIVPTAFNVDDCLNILLSGWGGSSNGSNLGGNVKNMPITPDAFQPNTDGNDFYFMVFTANADSLKFATYFGGPQSSEHVDGGTSRFDKNGNIYQAVCAGCGSFSDFPTTTGAWSSTNNSNNCNLGVIKFNFETNIRAQASLDSASTIDTNCNSLTLSFSNNSKNANDFLWDFGNGLTSVVKNPTVTYDSLGTYTIQLIAIDTLCDISDTTYLELIHDKGTRPSADFDVSYTSCDVFKVVNITNNSKKANKYYWDFGDGRTAIGFNPSHSYFTEGIFTITLIAVDTTCGASDTLTIPVDFTNNTPPPTVNILPDSCYYGGINVVYENDSAWYTYVWDFNGVIQLAKYPDYRYQNSGIQQFSLTILDTLCNAEYTFNFNENIQHIKDRVYIPNAFTPNRDNINEEFIIAGNECLAGAKFQIFDSYGNIIFETDDPFHKFWNGFINGKPCQEDVYIYYFKADEFEKRGTITVFY